MQARLSWGRGHGIRRSCLLLEQLEDRSLLSATPLDTSTLLLVTQNGDIQTVQLPVGADPQAELARYQSMPGIASVEFNQTGFFNQVVPNDTRWQDLWALQNRGQNIRGFAGIAGADIKATQAWDITTGSLQMVVGVIDTGVDYTHPDLYLNIWINPGEIPGGLGVVDTDSDGIITFYDLNNPANASVVSDLNGNGYIDGGDLLRDPRWANGQDNDNNGYVDDLIGWNFARDNNDPMDTDGHGTHVAGTIGAMGNNGLGIVGVNWRVRLVPMKFLDPTGTTADAIEAVNYQVRNNIPITNNSWGGGGFSSALNTAIGNARNAGLLFIAAAGNSNSNNDSVPAYPTNYPQDNIISVAASDNRDRRASFSNYGRTTVDIAAPGVDILSTVPRSVNSSGYAFYSGTSMAAPHVAGVAALLWSQDPTLTYRQVIDRILQGADRLSNWENLVATGARLNALTALIEPEPPVLPGARIIALTSDNMFYSSVLVHFDKSINPQTFTTADITGFTGPSGQAITPSSVTPVAGTNNTVFRITYPTQTQAGNYTLTIGPNIADVLGNLMNQDNNDTNGEPTDSYTGGFAIAAPFNISSSTRVQIQDLRTVTSRIVVRNHFTIEDLNVRLNISHTFVRDLSITLIAPNGTRVNLVAHRGGSGRNFNNTIFDDGATQSIVEGRAPFTGSFRPEQSLAVLNGLSGHGTWTLSITDNARGDRGILNSWSLMFLTSAPTVLRTSQPAQESSSTSVAPADADFAAAVLSVLDTSAVSRFTAVVADSNTLEPRDAVFLSVNQDYLRPLSQTEQLQLATEESTDESSEGDDLFADWSQLSL